MPSVKRGHRNLWLQRCKYFTVRVLEISAFLCYNGDSKNPPRAELAARLRWEVWYAIWGLTTVLTIYRFGLRGRYGLCGTKKHGFRTKKHEKARKKRQKTVIAFFGTIRPQVRTLSLGPRKVRIFYHSDWFCELFVVLKYSKSKKSLTRLGISCSF